jgi:ribosomal protein L32
MKFFPETVEWQRCERCGEPKRPHRICTDKADICAMRPEEFEHYKAAQKANEANNSNNKE